MAGNHTFYGKGLPYLNIQDLPGKLIVIEGADCSGRSTQVALLKEWLEARGHAVLDTGLKRSELVREIIVKAKNEGNVSGKTTMSLLYATDFADQLENRIIPALRAGFIVLADRYIFTLMARDMVRGAEEHWVQELFGFALVPDKVFYMQILPEQLLHRVFAKYRMLDYWESGMDMSLSEDMFQSFHKYQQMIKQQFDLMAGKFGFDIVDASQDIAGIQKYLRDKISLLL